jgi:hypothetical protein
MQAVDDALDEELNSRVSHSGEAGLTWTSTHPLVSLEEVPPLGVDGGHVVVAGTLDDGHVWFFAEGERSQMLKKMCAAWCAE